MSDDADFSPDTPPETLPEELAPLVAAMRADVLGPAAVADVARRVEQAIHAQPPHAAPTPVSQGAATTAAKGPWLTALAVTGGAALLIAALRWLDTGDTPPPSTPPAPATTSVPSASAPLPTSTATAGATEVAPAEASPAVDDNGAGARPTPQESPDAAAPTDGTAPPAARARSHAARLDPSAEADAEHVLLIEARRTLPGDPTRALALADQHAARFATGMLAPEREMIAVDALEALGRDDAARRRAAALAARWPGSSYARRVRARGLVP